MADTPFDELHRRRAAADDAAQALAREQEKLRGLQAQLRTLDRHLEPKSTEQRKARAQLIAARDASQGRADTLRLEKGRASESLARLRDQLAAITDPREVLGTLDARFPILLFPMRLETRFVAATADAGPLLLVRIYPDDCLVDSFEPDRSTTEVANLRRYWCAVWNAGGDEGRLRAAWRELCAAHGAGRALYLVRGYRPLAGSDSPPVRAPGSSDVVLVVAVDSPVAAGPERDATVAYWRDRWRQNTDAPFAALRAAVGDARAEQIRAAVVPYNAQERPQAGVDRATVPVSVVFVVLEPAATAATKRQAWTRPPRATLLPDRFVLIGDSGEETIELLGGVVQQPLAVGPDPLAEGSDQFGRDDGEVQMPPALAWMTDFDVALAAGLAFRVDLSARQARLGFDRLYVLGVRISSDATRAQGELEELIRHQAHSQAGFALVPQGTPTNNTEQGSSAWTRGQEADDLFAVALSAQADVDTFDAGAHAPYAKADGLRLAEALGIDPAVLQQVPNADGTDQAEGRAMNALLWPATLGYFLDTQLRPVFDDATIERTRRHFIDRVSGRGMVPAVRIGKQPYGILPTTAFSRVDAGAGFLGGLQRLLRQLDSRFWSGFAAASPRVGTPTSDPQRTLLDIIGLHPSSVDFHLSLIDSADRLWNSLHFYARFVEQQMRAEMQAGSDLLHGLGYSGPDPEIIQKFFSATDPMKRAVVDEAPLSETDRLPPCTPDQQNYLTWCRDRAERAFDELRRQVGFSDGGLPNALLYHLVRHALQLGYHGAAVGLHVAAELIPAAQLAAVYREPSFVHVDEQQPSESRYRLLYDRPTAITGDATKTVAEFIPAWVTGAGRASVLADQLEALRMLEQLPTARLERAFAEHLDLCSYRFDAWALSLVNQRLSQARLPKGDAHRANRGLYLGAFGWVENLRPHATALAPVTLPADLQPIFQKPGQAPLLRDPTNGGHVLAPSLNHATTAAVLRSGYLDNATPATPDLLAVDLSSARVRVALQFLEGVRNGQPLGALLGYQLERRLHDRHDEAEVDALIYQLRKAFPLAAKRIADSVDAGASAAAIQAIEARNVCDGLALLEHVRTNPVKTYPWGQALDRFQHAQEAIVNQEVAGLFEIQDAIADLALAESVHQMAAGNPERAAAAMDAYGKAGLPPEPDVATTPRRGTGLTHRVGLHLAPDAAPAAGATPRAAAEPAIDHWLATLLPPLADLVVHVLYTNATPNAPQTPTDVSMATLGLRPVDLLQLLDPDSQPAMNELDERIVRLVLDANGLCPDATVEIQYTAPVAGKKTVFETLPLIASLRRLVLEARPLKPSDAALSQEGSVTADAASAIATAPLDAAASTAASLRDDVASLLTTLTPLADPAAAFQDLVDAVDAAAATFVTLQGRAGLCGLSLTGSAPLLAGARDWFALVRTKARAVVAFWQDKLTACDALRAEGIDPTRPDSQRVQSLASAERAIATDLTAPLPNSPGALLAIVDGKRAAFITAKDLIDAVAASAAVTFGSLWTAWSATFAPRRAHDITVIGSAEEETALRTLVADMVRQLTGLRAELHKRLDLAAAARTAAATLTGQAQVQRLTDAAKALLGDGFRILPRFTLASTQADEWQNAYDARADLLSHLEATHEFPVDDWLYGLARVRPRLHALEKTTFFAGAFARPEPVLEPLQFPFRPGEPWLAMELPDGFDLQAAGEHVLYTAVYATGAFDKGAAAHCGLLLDEWTETVPTNDEVAGLAFHCDRPSTEAPQAMLLVVPASVGEKWTWLDLQQAIPETFDLARKRAAEPRDLAATPLSRFLPATVMASTASPISIGSRLSSYDVALGEVRP